MAVCEWCEQEMLVAPTCSVGAFHHGADVRALPPYGAECRFGPVRARGRCPDCGVLAGAFHHPGCDIAECPDCGGQLLSCGCRFDEDGPEGEEDEWVA